MSMEDLFSVASLIWDDREVWVKIGLKELKFGNEGEILNQNGLENFYYTDMMYRGIQTRKDHPILSEIVSVIYYTIHPFYAYKGLRTFKEIEKEENSNIE